MVESTQATIERLALDRINQLAYNQLAFDVEVKKPSPEWLDAIAAVKAKNIDAAIKAWNQFMAVRLKRTVVYHQISKVAFVD